MKRFLALVAVGAALGCSPVETTTIPPVEAPVPAPTPTDAASFLPAAVSSNGLEIESSRLALERSQSPTVREFARRMIEDHERASRELMTVTEEAGLGPVPLRINQRHQAMLDELRAVGSAGFDDAYAEMQRMAHDEAIALFGTYAEAGDQEALRQFASRTLPVLREHRGMVVTLRQAN